MIHYLPVLLEQRFGEGVRRWFTTERLAEVSNVQWDAEKQQIVDSSIAYDAEPISLYDNFDGSPAPQQKWEQLDCDEDDFEECEPIHFDLDKSFSLTRRIGNRQYDPNGSVSTNNTGAMSQATDAVRAAADRARSQRSIPPNVSQDSNTIASASTLTEQHDSSSTVEHHRRQSGEMEPS